MILIPSQDFAGEDGTMAEAMMRTTSLSNVSRVERVEDEDRNDGYHFWRKNPPRPLASRRVEALNQHQTLQTSQNLQTNLLGGGFTLPLPPPKRSGSLAFSPGWRPQAPLGI